MKRQWILVTVIVGLLLVLIGAGWMVRDRFLPVEVGTTAPDFSAQTLRGEPVALSGLRGQVVLLNIWATWCPPCREEMPSMERLYRAVGPEGLRIVAVSIDAGEGKVDASGHEGGNIAEFARDRGLTFDIWHDPEGRIQRTYRTTGVPESFLIDRDGTIIKKVIGATEWDSPATIELVRRQLQE
jgi:peroxiredoxin